MPAPIFVLPDIHGHKDKLDRALSLIESEAGPDAQIVFLGDYVDRGPDARGVLQTLIDGQAAGRNWTALRGNHDQLFLDFLTDARVNSPMLRPGLGWLNPVMGGLQTLSSYNIDAAEAHPEWQCATKSVPASHQVFLSDLPYTFETGDLLFVHAGIRPGIPVTDQDPEDLIWIRNEFLCDTTDHGKLVVHGHTPVEYPEHHGNRVALDGGAGFGRTLFVAVFEGRDCWLLDESGRHPLTP